MRQTANTTSPQPAPASRDEAYPAELHRYLVRQLRNREEAMDLAQEAYLRYLQLPDVSVVRDPGAYLFRIAFNLISEWRLRRDRAAVTVDSELADMHAAHVPADTPGPVEQLVSREQLGRVLEQIPTTYRRVLLMSKYDGLTNEQIGEQLGLTPASVTRYLGRALAFARRAKWE